MPAWLRVSVHFQARTWKRQESQGDLDAWPSFCWAEVADACWPAWLATFASFLFSAATLTAAAGCFPGWVQVCMTGPAELRMEGPHQIWSSTPTLLTCTQMPALLSCLLAIRLARAGQSLRQCLLRTGELPLMPAQCRDCHAVRDRQLQHQLLEKDAWPACFIPRPLVQGKL